MQWWQEHANSAQHACCRVNTSGRSTPTLLSTLAVGSTLLLEASTPSWIDWIGGGLAGIGGSRPSEQAVLSCDRSQVLRNTQLTTMHHAPTNASSLAVLGVLWSMLYPPSMLPILSFCGRLKRASGPSWLRMISLSPLSRRNACSNNRPSVTKEWTGWLHPWHILLMC